MDVVEVTADTCDGPNCGARAYVYAQINGRELTYCGHHGAEYMPKLTENAQIIIDLRHTIPA